MGCLFSIFQTLNEKEDYDKTLHIKKLYQLYNVDYDTDQSDYSPPSYYTLITKGND